MRKIFFFCALCASVMTVYAADGALNGKFTINDKGDQIVFSQGNLQFNAVEGTHDTQLETGVLGTWRFAIHQYDTIGGANSNLASDYDGWIDMFGWGTSGYNDIQPYNKSIHYTEYSASTGEIGGTNEDWGYFNAISNGGNEVGLWKTLSKDEWTYLLETRDNHANLQGRVTIGETSGYMILPDDWKLPSGLSFTPNAENYTTNVYTLEQWDDLEIAGAVFFPAGGRRAQGASAMDEIEYVGLIGVYWLSTYWGFYSGNQAYNFGFADDWFEGSEGVSVKFGGCVRLVQAASGTTTTIDNTEVVEKAAKLLRNGQLLILRDNRTYTLTGQKVK